MFARKIHQLLVFLDTKNNSSLEWPSISARPNHDYTGSLLFFHVFSILGCRKQPSRTGWSSHSDFRQQTQKGELLLETHPAKLRQLCIAEAPCLRLPEPWNGSHEMVLLLHASQKEVNHPNWKHPRRSVDNVSQNIEMKQINAHDLEQSSQLMWVKQCHVGHPWLGMVSRPPIKMVICGMVYGIVFPTLTHFGQSTTGQFNHLSAWTKGIEVGTRIFRLSSDQQQARQLQLVGW